MMEEITLNLDSFIRSDKDFFKLCTTNPEMRFEREASGKIIVMSPTGSKTGAKNLGIGSQLWNWNEQSQLGIAFDSSTGFKLPNGADRSPDASWIRQERWDALTAEEQEGFAPICPDFVIELRSNTDSLKKLQDKMREYMANGTRLGWLIDPRSKCVEIYRPGESVETKNKPAALFGDPELPGFRLALGRIF